MDRPGAQARKIARATWLAGVLLAPLAMGTVHTPVALCMVALMLVSCASMLRDHRRQAQGMRVSAVAIAALLLALVAMIQTIPAPPWLHRLLNPRGWSLYAEGMRALELGAPGWRPLSLDPAASADRALRWWALGLTALAAANLARRKEHLTRLLWVIPLSGMFVALVGLVQKLTGWTRFFGLFEARVAVRTLSTFVSPNHAAAFYGACALASATLAMLLPDQDHDHRKTLLAQLGVVCFTGLALAHGSVGVALLLLGSLALAWGLTRMPVSKTSTATHPATTSADPTRRRKRKRGDSRRKRRWGAGTLAGAATVVAGSALWRVRNHPALASVFEGHGARAEVYTSAAQGSVDFWRFGSGAGAVDRSLGPYLDWSALGMTRVPTVENELIELAFSTGWPVTLLTLALLAQHARAWWAERAASGPVWTTPQIMALVCALYTAGIAQLHFPFLALGVGLPLLALTEGLAARVRPRSARDETPHAVEETTSDTSAPLPAPAARVHERVPARAGRAIVAAGAVSAALMGWLALSGQRVPADEALMPGNPLTPATVRRMARLTPTEATLYWRLAIDALKRGETDHAARLIEHAHRLEPTPHIQLVRASVTARKGDRAEAARRFHALFRQPEAHRADWVRAMLADLPRAEDRAAVLHDRPALWPRALTLARQRAPEEAAALAIAITERTSQPERAELALLELYRVERSWEMVRRWAQLILLRRTTPTTREAAHLALVHATLALRQPRAHAEALRRALKEHPTHPDLLIHTLRALPAPDATLPDDALTRTRAAIQGACHTTHQTDRQDVCDRARAWLSEREGRLDAAQDILTGMTWRTRDPMPLTRFYLRHGRCLQLKVFASRWATRDAARRPHPAITAAQAKCRTP